MNPTRPAVQQASEPSTIGEKWYSTGMAFVLYIAGIKLLLHLLTANRYGFFGDEMYYLACAEHLDWGYVDQPPVIALIAWFVRHVLGESLFALHLLPAISGAARIVLTGIIARELGARRFGMTLAALGVFCSLIYWPLDHLFTMNTFEPLIWMGCAWLIILIVKTGNQKLWLWFGVLAGIGMQTKYSMAIFGLGVLVGVLLTPERKALASKWIWIGGTIAFLIFLPNLVWNIQHNWPFVELMRNIRASGRDVELGPVQWIVQQIVVMSPVTFPIWLAGLIYLFFSRQGKRFRIIGWTFVITATVLIVMKGKDYYLAPAYPMLFAAGGVALEGLLSRSAQRRLGLVLMGIYIGVMLTATALLLPLGIPVLSPEAFLRYQAKLPFQVQASEKSHMAASMPHYYTWSFGWPEMVDAVARTYNKLTPEERAKAAIFGQTFAQAGAIDFFGPRYGLPKAISGHQNYWLWGPRNYTGEIVLVLGSTLEEELKYFEQVEVGADVYHPYAYPRENRPVLICRRLKFDLQKNWAEVKSWD
ncbi:MAG TPA: glycosyltransferase family 39 protein [Terriglobales bacterium]|nr:glycosyltransferase family 39 protein [Terriglobales bacterium]